MKLVTLILDTCTCNRPAINWTTFLIDIMCMLTCFDQPLFKINEFIQKTQRSIDMCILLELSENVYGYCQMVALVGKKLGRKTNEIALVVHGGTVSCMNILIYS